MTAKFIFSNKPITTKLKYQGNPVQSFRIKPNEKGATIKEANKFIDSTMNSLFKQSKDSNKMFKIVYKLSDGKWYSGKFISKANEDYYPDVESQYGRDTSKDTVEHINISVVSIKK